MRDVRNLRSRTSTLRGLAAGGLALALAAAGLVSGGAAAQASVSGGAHAAAAPAAVARTASLIPDPQLTACINNRLGNGRPLDQEILQEDLDKLTTLTCNADYAVTSFAGIETAAKLGRIEFLGKQHDLSAAGALTALGQLPTLKWLKLPDTKISNASLTGLASATKLTDLDLSNSTGLTDLSPLAGLTNLENLYLANLTALTNVEPLSALTKIGYLTLQKAGVSDIAPLTELTAMGTLILESTNVDSLLPLSKMTNLKTLNVSRSKVTSLAGLADASGLQTLDIGYTSIGNNLSGIENKPNLTRLTMNGIGASDQTYLRTLSGLSNVQALGNGFASLVGVPEVPAGGNMSFAQQVIDDAAEYVPRGATKYRYDLSDDLENRKGEFPTLGGNLVPTFDPDFPIVSVDIRPAWGTIEYTFEEINAAGNDRYTGKVVMPIVWSDITSPDSAELEIGLDWSQQTTVTDGFPVKRYELVGQPSWASIDPATGVISAQAPGVGDWWFTVNAYDELGNVLTQKMNLVALDVDQTTVDFVADQTGEAGSTLTFTVTRDDEGGASSYQGRTEVKYRTVDGAAIAGEHYVQNSGTLVWDAGDFNSKSIEVTTLPVPAGDPQRGFTIELLEPEPEDFVQIGSNEIVDGTITSRTPTESVVTIAGDQSIMAGEEATVTISREDAAADNDPWLGEVRATLVLVDDEAIAGEHYEALAADESELVWAPGDTADKTVTIRTTEVPAGDPIRNFGVLLTDPSEYAMLGEDDVAEIAIVAYDPQPSDIVLSSVPETVDAGQDVVITVDRVDAAEHPWTGEASVRVRTVDGAALAGTHFAALDEVLTWAPGDTESRELRIETTPGFEGSSDRDFEVELLEPSTYAELGDPAEAWVTIQFAENGDGGNGDGDNGGNGNGGGTGKPDPDGKQPGTQLPNTGGTGPAIGIFLAGALLLIAGTGALTVRARRAH